MDLLSGSFAFFTAHSFHSIFTKSVLFITQLFFAATADVVVSKTKVIILIRTKNCVASRYSLSSQ